MNCLSFHIHGYLFAGFLLREVDFDHIHVPLGHIDFQIGLLPIDPNSSIYCFNKAAPTRRSDNTEVFPQRCWKARTCHRLDVD